jgi:ribonucleoside-diphosphate reductase alpha chain
MIKKRDGSVQPLNVENIRKQTIPACEGLSGVSYEDLELSAHISFVDGMKSSDIQELLIKTALSKVDVDGPNWTFVAERLALYELYHAIKREYDKVGSGDVYTRVTLFDYFNKCRDTFSDFIDKYTADDIWELNKIIDPDRDLLFDYAGFEACRDRYLHRIEGRIVELPQHMHMAIAMFMASVEEPNDRLEYAKQFYNATSTLKFINATPINSNGRIKNGSTASCMVTSIPDNLNGIFDGAKLVAQGSKSGAGWGIDWTRLRASGSTINGRPNSSNGPVPFLKIFNDIAIAVNQGGRRAGAFAVYMETWHIDIFDFLDMTKKSGEERLRAQDLFLVVSASDLFMNRVKNDELFTLFDPYDTPELTECYGDEFEHVYCDYESQFLANPSKFNVKTKQIKAKDLMRKLVVSYFEEGQPWWFFKDTTNRYHNNPEMGIIRSSNLCVTGDTKVLTKKYGYIPIQDAAGKTLKCWDGKQWTKTKLFKTSDGQQVDEVFLSNGFSIKATPYHKWYKILQDKRGKLLGSKEVRTHELCVGDKLIKFNIEPVTHGTKKLNYAYENGFLSGDGIDVNKSTKRIALYNEKKELLSSFSNYDFVSENNTGNKSGGTRFNLTYKDKLKRKYYVPSSKYSVDSRLKWLAGLFDADGTLTTNNGTESIQIASIEHSFLKKVYLLLQELGIQAKVVGGIEEGFRVLPKNNGTGESKEYWCKETKRLIIPHSELNKLLSIGYKANRVMPNYKDLNREAKQFIKITKITEIEELVPTYCGETRSKEHKLMFNGVLTGNCTEFMNPTTEDEVAVCNLGSINLARIVDEDDLIYISKLATRMLDNVVSVTDYPNKESEQTQLSRRSIGIGLLGEAQVVANNQIYYTSDAHEQIIHEIYGTASGAIQEATEELAQEKGALANKSVRNAYTMCVAPNSTSGLFAGTTNSHEPTYDRVWIEENKLGNIKMTAPGICPENWEYYQNPYELDQKKMIDMTAIRQQYIDMGISHNLFFDPEQTTAKDILDAIMHAWDKGLKSLYYLRSQPPSNNKIKETKISCVGCEN